MTEGIDLLWPTPVLTLQVADADRLNQGLVELAEAHRKAAGAAKSRQYASEDDLLRRYRDGALPALFEVLSEAVFKAASQVNASAWAQMSSPRMRVDIIGAWFQTANDGAFHDVHNHGNCSWSGVYYAQVDDPATRVQSERFGVANGVTRFYGPYLERLGGAHMDLGAAYLQQSHFDVPPVPGRAVVFPSHLLHKAMPYEGTLDRMIFSFNAQLHGIEGDRTAPFGH